VQAVGFALLAGHVAIAATASAQANAAATITTLTAVDVPPVGNPPTGPFAVVVEHDPGLATHTIYRPRELSLDEHPVLVWGEGGCAKNGLMFPEYLSEIASHGFVVIADGPPIARPPGGPGAGGGGPPGGGAGPGAGGGGLSFSSPRGDRLRRGLFVRNETRSVSTSGGCLRAYDTASTRYGDRNRFRSQSDESRQHRL
jgi:hypothetical protein